MHDGSASGGFMSHLVELRARLLKATAAVVVLFAGFAIFAERLYTRIAQPMLDALPAGVKVESITLHPTCSTTHLGIQADLEKVAAAAATEVRVPTSWGCCGYAGDRGMLHPELTDAATTMEARDVERLGSAVHASCNRTCELGMTRATGEDYHHVLEVLEQVTR